MNINQKFYSVWAKENSLYVQFAKKLGIGYPEMIVLYALTMMDGITQKEISENFGLQKQTVNTVIRNLKQNDYILLEVCKEDKRERSVILTEKGKEYAIRIIKPVFDAENKVYKIIGNERLIQANETMKLFNLLFEKEIEGNLK